jgi:predicted transcriptional regulator
MQNNSTVRLFEDKLDKFVQERLYNEQDPVQDTEWNSMQERLLEFRKQANRRKTRTIVKTSVVLLFLSVGTLVLIPGKNKNTVKNLTAASSATGYNTPVTKNPAGSINHNTETSSTPDVTSGVSFSKDETGVTKRNREELIGSDIGNSENKIKYSKTPNPEFNRSRLYPVITGKDMSNIPDKIKENEITTATISDMEISDKEGFQAQHKSGTVSEITKQHDAENKEEMNTNPKEEVISTIPAKSVLEGSASGNQSHTVKQPEAKKQKKAKRERLVPEHNFSPEKQWYLEAWSGMNNSMKERKSFAAFLAPAGYTNMRLHEESALSSFQGGVQVKMRKNHLVVSSGFSYVQFGDKVAYTKNSVGAFATAANGTTNFTYLELPVTAGYEWANKRWGFSLQGGLSAGFLMNLKGQYVSINNFNTQLFNVNENKSNFKKSIYNLIFNPQLNYFVNENINVFVTPVYRRNIQPITAPGADLKQKYNAFGFSIGIRSKL